MKINRAYKFRIYPNQEQKTLLDKTFGSCRFLWNQMLDERKKFYAVNKDNKEVLYNHKYKTEAEYKKDYKFLKEVDSKALQSTTRNMISAFQNFFNGIKETRKVGYPKFKSRKNKQSYATFNINNNIKIDFSNNKIKLPKIKTWINYRDDRIFDEPINQITASKTKSGKYYVSILIDREIDVKQKEQLSMKKIEAFDMSSPNFVVSSNIKMKNPRFYKNEEKQIIRLHRRLSRKTKSSNNRYKARVRLARKYEAIQNRKKDWTEKLTRELVENYDAIILEDLNIDGMRCLNSGLAKSVTLDFSWYQFTRTLQYKMEERGKHLVFVDRFFASSKLCSNCGAKNDELQLSDRFWVCKSCGVRHDRDVNASQNLFNEGISFLKSQNIMITLP